MDVRGGEGFVADDLCRPYRSRETSQKGYSPLRGSALWLKAVLSVAWISDVLIRSFCSTYEGVSRAPSVACVRPYNSSNLFAIYLLSCSVQLLD